MRWAFERGERVLFLPDEPLGRNTAFRMGIPLDKMAVCDHYEVLGGNSEAAIRSSRVLLWKGCCSVHQRFTPEHVARVRREHPGIRVVAHPECRFEVAQAADFIGSTEQIKKIVGEAEPGSQWALGTQIHMVNRPAKQYTDRMPMSLDPTVSRSTTLFSISP